MKHWDFEKNKDINISKITPKSNKVAFWNCKHGHQWSQYIAGRLRFDAEYCPVCVSLQILRPDLANEWNSKKNYPLTAGMVTLKSKKKVWWISKNGYEWEEVIANRVKRYDRKLLSIKKQKHNNTVN